MGPIRIIRLKSLIVSFLEDGYVFVPRCKLAMGFYFPLGWHKRKTIFTIMSSRNVTSLVLCHNRKDLLHKFKAVI